MEVRVRAGGGTHQVVLQAEDDDDDGDEGDEAQRVGRRYGSHASSPETLSHTQTWIFLHHLLSIELSSLMCLRHVHVPHGRE